MTTPNLNFQDKLILQQGGICIFEFSATAADGKPHWYVMAFTDAQLKTFNEATQTGMPDMQLTDYGQLMATGPGNECPQNAKEKIAEVFGVDLYNQQP